MTKKECVKKTFDELTSKYHNLFCDSIRWILYEIKETNNWTNEDLAFWLDTNEHRIGEILSGDWDGRMSNKTMCKIFLLALGEWDLIESLLSNEDYDSVLDILNTYNEEKYEELEPETREDKVNTLLKMFGVTDDDSLDRLIDNVKEVRFANHTANVDFDNWIHTMQEDDDNCKTCKCTIDIEGQTTPDGTMTITDNIDGKQFTTSITDLPHGQDCKLTVNGNYESGQCNCDKHTKPV